VDRHTLKSLHIFAFVFALFVICLAYAIAQGEEEPPLVGPVIFNEAQLDEYPFCPGS